MMGNPHGDGKSHHAALGYHPHIQDNMDMELRKPRQNNPVSNPSLDWASPGATITPSGVEGALVPTGNSANRLIEKFIEGRNLLQKLRARLFYFLTATQNCLRNCFFLFPVYSLCDRFSPGYLGMRFLFLSKKTPRHLIQEILINIL